MSIPGTGTYLDHLDEPDEESEFDPDLGLDRDIAPPVAVKVEAIGTTVNLEEHAKAFRRKHYGVHYVPGTPEFIANERKWSWPVPPAIPMRDALPEEVPREAMRAWVNAKAGGWTPRLTFAQSGAERKSASKGKCVCGTVVRLYIETGFMFEHKAPEQPEKVACDGTIINQDGTCRKCSAKVKRLKSGFPSKHYLKTEPVMCEHVELPHEVVVGEPLSGRSSSVVLRIPGLGVAAWENPGGFRTGWLLNGKGGVYEVGADEFQEACRRRKEC